MDTSSNPVITALEEIARTAGEQAAATAARAAAILARRVYPGARALVLKYEYEGDLVYMAPVSITGPGGTELWTADGGDGLAPNQMREREIGHIQSLCGRLTASNKGGWYQAVTGEPSEDLRLMDVDAAMGLGAVPLWVPFEQLARTGAVIIAGRALSEEEDALIGDSVRNSLVPDVLESVIRAALAQGPPCPDSIGQALADKAYFATGSAITALHVVHDLHISGRIIANGTASDGIATSARHSARVLADSVGALNRFTAAAAGLTESLVPVQDRHAGLQAGRARQPTGETASAADGAGSTRPLFALDEDAARRFLHRALRRHSGHLSMGEGEGASQFEGWELEPGWDLAEIPRDETGHVEDLVYEAASLARALTSAIPDARIELDVDTHQNCQWLVKFPPEYGFALASPYRTELHKLSWGYGNGATRVKGAAAALAVLRAAAEHGSKLYADYIQSAVPVIEEVTTRRASKRPAARTRAGATPAARPATPRPNR